MTTARVSPFAPALVERRYPDADIRTGAYLAHVVSEPTASWVQLSILHTPGPLCERREEMEATHQPRGQT